MKKKIILLISMIILSSLVFGTNFGWASTKDTLVIAVAKTPPGIDCQIDITVESHDVF